MEKVHKVHKTDTGDKIHMVAHLLTCLSLSRVRMFSTARTLRRYFSMAASLSADWLLSVLAASRANISLSSGPWMSYSNRGTQCDLMPALDSTLLGFTCLDYYYI